ncbi:MAG: hypothetical protein Q7T33_09850 [Dehalococcoidia bacterium]|nr:hypothetical protein [Dehalococcoidia bacterium]
MALTFDARDPVAGVSGAGAAARAWPAAIRMCSETVLWALLGLTTALLLAYPIRPSLEYHPIQSIEAITDLSLFAGLFYGWLAVLFSLFLLRGESKGAQLTLVAVFALVTSGLWTILAWGNSGEAPLYAAQVEHINQTHSFDLEAVNFAYFQFPALFVLSSAVSQVTGLSTWDTVVTLVLLNGVLIATLLYLAFYNVTGSPRLAWLGVLLLLQGNIIIAKMLSNFHPGAFGFLLYAGFLAVVTSGHQTQGRFWQNRLLMVVLLAGATTAHFVTSVAILVVIAGMVSVRWLSGQRPQEGPAVGASAPGGLADRARVLLLPGLALPLVLPLAWEIYHAVSVFGSLARLTEGTWEGFVRGEVLTGYAYYRVGSYVEQSAPWSLALRYVWLLVGMGLGSLVGLIYIVRVKRLAPNEAIALGGLTGIGLLGIAIALASSGEDMFRVLFYVPVFTVLLLLLGIKALGPRLGRYAFGALALLIFTLSFPTLLNNNYTVGFSVYYPTELASGEFLRSQFGRGESLEVFGSDFPTVYYTPGAKFRFPDPLVVGGANFWTEVQDDVERFKATAAEPDKSGIWILSDRLPSDLRHLLGPSGPTHPEYKRLFGQEIPQGSDEIYDDGGVRFFRVGHVLH